MQELNPAPLRECLLTRARASVTLRLAVATPQCSQPPFDSGAPQLSLWTWPWTDWTTFNQSVLDQDVQRILRWYQARGFYDATVEGLSFDPPEAGTGKPCRSDDCTVEVSVNIHEGQPVLTGKVELAGISELKSELSGALGAALRVQAGKRFDEVDYDQSKQALVHALRNASFAAANVRGRFEIMKQTRTARVTFAVEPGKPYTFGPLTITGQGPLAEAPIRAAAGLVPGEPYRPARLEELRVEVLALGTFASVETEEKPDAEHGRVGVTLKVALLAPVALRLGAGVTSGASQRNQTGELESIPQWDTHLFARYERRHIADTLGSLRVEERPRLIYSAVFPTLTSPSLGNIITAKVNQPGVIEARTDLFAESSWDYGPDPFLSFTRSDISLRAGLRRGFFTRRLVGTLALEQDIFVVPSGADNVASDGTPTPASYEYGFAEQDLHLDLRDQPVQPNHGAYFALNATESIKSFASDWTSLRLIPDVRGYIPLPFSSVFAVRFALGALLIFDVNPNLDDLSRQLGPSSYRLRGGGANSVRGFLPGELGAGTQGGLRRWESMLEWRVHLGASLTVATFLDMGDVNDQASFRFDHLNTSAGFGFRYHTLLGPIRLDAGFRIVDWQRVDGSPGIEEGASTFPFTNVPGALHLTIGDPF